MDHRDDSNTDDPEQDQPQPKTPQPKAKKGSKVATSVEELLELLAIRVMYLDKYQKLSDSELDKFCEQQSEEVVDEFEKFKVINVENIAAIFKTFTSRLGNFKFGAKSWALAENIRKQTCKQVPGGRQCDAPVYPPDDYTFEFGENNYTMANVTPYRPKEMLPYTAQAQNAVHVSKSTNTRVAESDEYVTSRENTSPVNSGNDVGAVTAGGSQFNRIHQQPVSSDARHEPPRYSTPTINFGASSCKRNLKSNTPFSCQSNLPQIIEQYSAEASREMVESQLNKACDQQCTTATAQATIATTTATAAMDQTSKPAPNSQQHASTQLFHPVGTDNLLAELRAMHEQREQDQALITRAQASVEAALKSADQMRQEHRKATKHQHDLEELIAQLETTESQMKLDLADLRKEVEQQKLERTNEQARFNQFVENHIQGRKDEYRKFEEIVKMQRVECSCRTYQCQQSTHEQKPEQKFEPSPKSILAEGKPMNTAPEQVRSSTLEAAQAVDEKQRSEFRDRLSELEKLVASDWFSKDHLAKPAKLKSALNKPKVSFKSDQVEPSSMSNTSTELSGDDTDYSECSIMSTTEGESESEAEPRRKGRGRQQLVIATPPVFNQVNSKEEDMHTWFKNLEKYASAMGWDSEQMAAHAAVHFHGIAEEYYEELSKSERKSYRVLKKHMLKRMKVPGAESRNCSEYQTIQQMVGESSTEFANRIQNLVNKTPSLKKEKSARSIARHFVERSNPAISAILSIKRFGNLQEARRFAERIDSTSRHHQRIYQDDLFVNATQQTRPEPYSYQPQQARHYQYQQQQRSPIQPQPLQNRVRFNEGPRQLNSGLTCLNCGSADHLLISCPTVDRSQICEYCGRKGHPTKCCLDKYLNKPARIQQQSGNGSASGIETTRMVRTSSPRSTM